MMINCPNCNLLQPKDQYCAQCGINMETWRPPQKPAWKKLIGNWMFQLAALFLLIFAVVLRDNFTAPAARTTNDSLPPVSKQIARNNSASFAPVNKQKSRPTATQQRKKKKEVSSKESVKSLSSMNDITRVLENKISIEIITISRGATEKLQSIAKKLDDSAMHISQKKASSFRRRHTSGIKSLGKKRKDFQFNQAIDLFVGEQDRDTELNLGFYVQVIISENSTVDAINAEVRFSSVLKLSGEPTATLSYDVVLNQKDSFFIIDPGIHDLEFTKEERDLFEASRKLRHLNNDRFIESLSDIALVLKIK